MEKQVSKASSGSDKEKKSSGYNGNCARFFEELSAAASERISNEVIDVVAKLTSNRDYDMTYVCTQFGIGYDILYAVQIKKRNYPLDKLGIFCDKFANKSCHELATGTPKPVMLPSIPAYMVKALIRLPKAFNLIPDVIKNYRSKVKSVFVSPSSPDLYLQRLKELADDYQVPVMRAQALVWGNTPQVEALFTAQDRGNIIRRVSRYNFGHIKLMSALTLSYLVDEPLDYLICDNYARTCDIAYRGDKGEPVIVKDPKIVEAMQIYLSLPDELKCQMFSDIALQDIKFNNSYSAIRDFAG